MSGSGGNATGNTGGSSNAMGGMSGGGSSGAGGTGAGMQIVSFDFQDSLEGWQFVYAEPATLIAPPAPVGDAGADAGEPEPVPEGVASATHDAAIGDPAPGSALLSLPFDAGSQKISYEVSVVNDGAGVDLTGRAMSVRIKVDMGLATNVNFPAGVKLYVKTGADFVYADSGFINIESGDAWQTFTWANVSFPVYPPTGAPAPVDVRQVGIEFATGDCGLGAAGCPEGSYVPATVHMDTFGS
jgi:hypothetical protein